MLILLIVLIFVFGFGGNFYNGGAYRTPGIGIGAILLILVVILLFGGFGHIGRLGY